MKNVKSKLDGNWEFKLDQDDRGRQQQWWRQPGLGGELKEIKVPGAWQAQGFGGEFKHSISQMGHPSVRVERHGYKGTAWYRKIFRIPAAWQGRRVWLDFGGVKPRAEFWVNGHYLGQDPGGLLEFSLDITKYARWDAENVLVVRMFESGNGDWSRAIEGGIYNWATVWGGLYRSVALHATGDAWIENITVLPNLARKQASIQARLGHAVPTGARLDLDITIQTPDGGVAAHVCKPVRVPAGRRKLVKTDIALDDVQPWSLESPALYQVQVKLLKADTVIDERSERFGMRDIAVRGRHITLNGRPVFLRGFGWNMVFPRTLSPDLDKQYIRKQILTARAFGFNSIDTYCVPHRELLDVADEVGMLIQVYPGDLSATALEHREHLEQLMRQAMNHPSIMSYGWSAECYGNAPEFVRKIDRLYAFAKKIDPTRLSLGRDGSHLINFGHGKTDFEEPACCYRGCYANAMLEQATDKPVLLHELGWFSSYPNPALKHKYRNLPLLPFHITYAEEMARRQGVSKLLPVFVRNSERLQAMEHKMAIECLRKVPAVAGFHIWMGHDTVSAVEGVWDDFGDPKSVTPADFRKHNGDTVLLMQQDYGGMAAWVVPPDDTPETNPHDICREWQGRNLWDGEMLKVDLLTSHYGAQPISGGELRWSLTAMPSGRRLAGGVIKKVMAQSFTTSRLASLRILIPRLDKAVKMVLRVELRDRYVQAVNHWDFWGFPRGGCLPVEAMRGVYGYGKPGQQEYGMDLAAAGVGGAPYFFAKLPRLDLGGHHGAPVAASARAVVSLNMLSNGLLDYLEAGGRVCLLTERLFPEYFHRFRSLPWHQAPYGNCGTIVNDHPCLEKFPHEGFCDLQFYDMARTISARSLEDGGVVNLDIWPGRIEPIIRSIDSYMGARRRGLLFEVRVGRGRLMVSRLNFVDTPAARFLAGEIIRYILSDDHRPPASVPPGFLRNFVNQRG